MVRQSEGRPFGFLGCSTPSGSKILSAYFVRPHWSETESLSPALEEPELGPVHRCFPLAGGGDIVTSVQRLSGAVYLLLVLCHPSCRQGVTSRFTLLLSDQQFTSFPGILSWPWGRGWTPHSSAPTASVLGSNSGIPGCVPFYDRFYRSVFLKAGSVPVGCGLETCVLTSSSGLCACLRTELENLRFRLWPWRQELCCFVFASADLPQLSVLFCCSDISFVFVVVEWIRIPFRDIGKACGTQHSQSHANDSLLLFLVL